MISFISSLEIINVVKPDPNIFLWITTSVVDAAAAVVNPNGIKTLSANALSTFPIKDNLAFWPSSTFFVLPAAGVFPVISIFYLNDSDRLILLLLSAIFPHTSWCFQTIIAIFNYIIHWHLKIYKFWFIYLSIIYFSYAVSE